MGSEWQGAEDGPDLRVGLGTLPIHNFVCWVPSMFNNKIMELNLCKNGSKDTRKMMMNVKNSLGSTIWKTD